MPNISERGKEMPASPIRKLAPLADAAKQRGVHVYHLNIGQPDLPTPPEALEAIRNIDRKVLEYSPSQGYRSYREKLVKYYDSYDIHLTADDIIITTGGSEAVLFAFMSCLNPGDEIIIRTNYGTYKYAVREISIVSKDDREAFKVSQTGNELVFFTCYPLRKPSNATQRMVVYADLVSGPGIVR